MLLYTSKQKIDSKEFKRYLLKTLICGYNFKYLSYVTSVNQKMAKKKKKATAKKTEEKK